MLKKFEIFLPLVKVDLEKKEVWGVAAEEQLDKDGEIFDYKSSKPFFEKWSAEFSKATNGKSLGNVRAMHEPVAAGKLIHLEFLDEQKKIYIGAKIVDEKEWEKVTEGVYTGFSMGGRYEKMWKDGDLLRYTANPVEISVVDNPCMYGAHFDAIKADGSKEIRKFAEKNTKARKSLYDVGDLACAIQTLQYITSNLTWEAEFEQDGSAIPARLKAVQADLGEILKDLAAEEVDELMDSTLGATIELSAKSGNAAEEKLMNEQELNKALAAQKAEGDKELAKMTGQIDTLSKALEANKAETAAEIKKLTDGFNDFMSKFHELLKTVVPTKVAVNGVGVAKEHDNTTAAAAKKDATPVDLMKSIHQTGGNPIVLGSAVAERAGA